MGKPIAGLVVGDVLAHELVDRLADVVQELHVSFHLADRRIRYGIKSPIDQVSYKRREGDCPESLLGDAGNLPGGSRAEVVSGGLGVSQAARRGSLLAGRRRNPFPAAHQRHLVQAGRLAPVVANALGGISSDLHQVALQAGLAVLR